MRSPAAELAGFLRFTSQWLAIDLPRTGLSAVRNRPHRALAAPPDVVQARSESSPEWEEFHHEARDYGTTVGSWPVS